jgi:hypothetical protein
MRFIFSKKRRLQARASASRFQYQLSVRYMPCVVFRPSEWMSLMKTSRPGQLHRLGDAELVGRLDRVDGVAAGVGQAQDLRLAACACSRKEEKSLADSGCLTEPTTCRPRP